MFCIDNHCEEKTAFGAILLLICVTLLFRFLILCALPAFTRENVYIYICLYWAPSCLRIKCYSEENLRNGLPLGQVATAILVSIGTSVSKL